MTTSVQWNNGTKMNGYWVVQKKGETSWGLYLAYVHVWMSLNRPHPSFLDHLWIEIKTSKYIYTS